MATHLFLCPDGHEIERNYGFSDMKPNKITCHCKKIAKRKYTAPNISFKGPGFYKTNG